MTIKSKYFTSGIHVLVWTALLVVPAIVFQDVKFDTGLPEYFFLITNLYHITLFYFNAYWLYPRFLTRKRWWMYIFFLVIIVVGSYHAKVFLLRLVYAGFIQNEINERIIFFPPIAFLIASCIFRLVVDRIRFEKSEKERKAERLASELKFLRSQVSPHFLFNVLTNMVSLARKKSGLLEPALIQLSDLLRYMLYETGNDKFPVSKEIEYLKNYIELQQLRFGEDANVQLDIQNEQPDCAIEPMLLIPFVENAFKHGIGMVKDPYIKIALEIKKQHLFFRVSNNYDRGNLSKDNNSGIGLANVKNRLDLLYKHHHDLLIEDNGEIYTIELNLDLEC
jgi:two-component system LytT family sensor kinase